MFRMNVRTTISLPKPQYEYARRESRKLMKREKGVEKENISMFLNELLREARVKAEPQSNAA